MNIEYKLSLITPFCKGRLADGLKSEKAVSFGILVCDEASSLALRRKQLIALSCSKYYWATLTFLLADTICVLFSHWMVQFTLQLLRKGPQLIHVVKIHSAIVAK